MAARKAATAEQPKVTRSRRASTDQGPAPEVRFSDSGLVAPDFSYIQELISERQRLYSTAGVPTSPTGQVRETESILRTRSYDEIVREIRRMRAQLLDPNIPEEYKKTTRVLRMGQALLGDLCIRLPALLAAKPMQVTAKPHDEREDAQIIATLKEDWTHAVLLGQEGERGLMDNGATSVWRDLYDNLFHTGRGAFLLTCRTDRWSKSDPDYPDADDYEDDPNKPLRESFEKGAKGLAAWKKAKAAWRSKDVKYQDAIGTYQRDEGNFPFELEQSDPLSVHIREDFDGIEDEAIVFNIRSTRETLIQSGLLPAADSYKGSDVLVGRSGSRYVIGPMGVGKPYPPREYAIRSLMLGQGVETVTYYCSAKRAAYLGLSLDGTAIGTDGSVGSDGSIGKDGSIGTTVKAPADGETADEKAEQPAKRDRHLGIWAQYVDGIPVQSGPLPGPSWHPLPLFHCYGQSTAMPDPTYRGIPAVYYIIELCHALDRFATMQEQVAAWASWPPMIEHDIAAGGTGNVGLPGQVMNDPESLQRPNRDISQQRLVIAPGGYYEMPAGRDVDFKVMPAEAVAILRNAQEDMLRYFELLGIADVLRGAGGNVSGYAEAMKMIAARVSFDSIVDNATTCVQTAIKYLWWQVWKRFPEGVPAWVGGEPIKGKKKGYITLKPSDIAPDASGAGKGTPFLACQVKADPLLPLDEAQLEQRGLNALAGRVLSMDEVREEYFRRKAPERTAARVLADAVVQDPYTQACLVVRAQVRQKILLPELAPLVFANKTGLDLQQAQQQLAYIGGLPEETQVMLEQQALQAATAGGPLPGMQSVPGVPGLPGQVNPGQIPPIAPTPPSGPPQGGGMMAGSGAAMPPTQPAPGARMAAAMGR